MSKSFGKYKTLGYCTGSNTDYYAYKRRKRRVLEKRALQKAVQCSETPEEIDENFTDPKMVLKDSWDEPTDGTWQCSAKDAKDMFRNPEYHRTSYGIYAYDNNHVKK